MTVFVFTAYLTLQTLRNANTQGLSHAPLISFQDDGTRNEADSIGSNGGEGDELSLQENEADDTLRYTTDLSDVQLKHALSNDPSALGSASLGVAEAGRLVNGVPFPDGDGEAFTVLSPESAFGTQETIEFVMVAAGRVKQKFPDAPPLRINHIGKAGGGYLKPHRTHQSGRDVDLGFYYKPGVALGSPNQRREKLIDLAANWQLIRTLATETDVHFILVDERIQRVLYAYALKLGEDKEWLNSLFHNGANSLFHHARHHRDHFHVRFYSARSQELGRRLQPLLAAAPQADNAPRALAYRVQNGDTLGKVASRFHTSVRKLEQANNLKSSALRIGQVLQIPTRKPIQVPMAPAIEIPPRRVAPFDPTEKPTG
jgi:LysM repeat protein